MNADSIRSASSLGRPFGTSAEATIRDQNVARYSRLQRLFMEQMEQLQRLRGKSGQQRVVVEHVTVNAGGQAIVGVVERGKGERANKKPKE